MSAIELQIRFKELQADRVLAPSEGLAADSASMVTWRTRSSWSPSAYVEAAVTGIATLRDEAFGSQAG